MCLFQNEQDGAIFYVIYSEELKNSIFVDTTVGDRIVWDDNLDKFVEIQPPIWAMDPVPFVAAVCARLAEIGVRIIFISMTFVSVLVFEEIDDEIIDIVEISAHPKQQNLLASKLDQLISQNDLCSRLIEQINRCFGLVILFFTCVDFISAIFHFFKIYTYFKSLGLDIDFELFEIFPRESIGSLSA